jgi:hypothetical protein
MKVSVISILCAFISSQAYAGPLVFNGVDGNTTIVSIKTTLPNAIQKRSPLCKPDVVSKRYADGVTRCDYFAIDSYKLGGYDFSVRFYFADDGGLKTASLSWPGNNDDSKTLTEREIRNAYRSLVDMFVGKYGNYVYEPPCYLVSKRCTEWQMDGSTKWHEGGERIKIEYEAKLALFSGVSITYSFANTSSYDKF